MRIVLIIGILAIAGCTSRQEPQSSDRDTSHQEIKKSEAVYDTLVKSDTRVNKVESPESFDSCYWFKPDKEITPSGNFITYERFDNYKYRITWGNKTLKRILPDTFYCTSPPATQPRFERENKYYIQLKSGCGHFCHSSVFLPLNTSQAVTTIYYDYAVDLDQHLVAALDSDKTKTFIAVHNLKTGSVKEIKIDPPCESAIPPYCLDSLSINGQYLYYRWLTDIHANKSKEQTVKIR